MQAQLESDPDLDSWTAFISAYARGQYSSPPTLPPPPSSEQLSPSLIGTDLESPVYSSVEITRKVVSRVREFYTHNRFLPPPRAPLEHLREQCILQYDLYSEQQNQNIQAATDLIQAYLGGICTFTLFRDNVQELRAISGPQEVFDAIGLFPGKRLLPETSLCGHSVLSPVTYSYVPDLSTDWRYAGNPYADEVKGVKSYLGSVISLNVDPSSSTEKRVVGIGVINCMHLDSFLPPLNAEQEKFVKQVSNMLESQLRATWEGHRRTREARTRKTVSDLIEIALGNEEEASHRANPFVLATAQIKDVLEEIDGIGILDLRAVHAIRTQVGVNYILNEESRAVIEFLAWQCTGAVVQAPILDPATIIQYLREYRSLAQTEYPASSPSPLSQCLPSTTQSHCIVPFFTYDQPLFAILATTSDPRFRFGHFETNFLKSVGNVLRAHILESKLKEADAAKTVFLSSISHELRTPMHGLLSGVQLFRNALDMDDVEQARRIAEDAESSGYVLQQILNDMLDFSAISKPGETDEKVVRTDLRSSVLTAMEAVQAGIKGQDVVLSARLEDRDWTADIDSSGFHRILLNGLTNAIKFTSAGSITLELSSSDDNSSLTCCITDSGKGIDPNFAPRMFKAFTKADSFTPGAGLGLYITKSLVDRMGGTLSLAPIPPPGRGTRFAFTLPVQFAKAKNDSERECNMGSPVSISFSGLTESCSEMTPVSGHVKQAQTPAHITSPGTEKSLSDSMASLQVTDDQERSQKVDASSRTLIVLVVDDNPIGRKILTAFLLQISRQATSTKPLLIETHQAEDGLEAVNVFKKIRPQLVFTDVSMPVMDGITSAGEMRTIEREWGVTPEERSKIYAITGLGNSDPRMKTDAIRGEARLDGWLVKGSAKLERIREIVIDAAKAVE